MKLCFASDQSQDNFAKWAKTREIFLHPDVAFLVPTKTMGLGVFARRPLKPGTVVISCPAATALSPYAEPTHESPCLSALTASGVTDHVLRVVLQLMAEAIRPASVWAPWLRACPRMPHHFFQLDDAQRHAFGLSSSAAMAGAPLPPSAWTGVAQQLREARAASRWDAARDVMRRFPEHWPEGAADFALFAECLAQVLSRNFHREEIAGREGPYLLPGLDIINHSFTPNGRFEIRGGGRKHAMQFCVIAERDVKRGEQIFCSYGRIGAPRFAVEFQFVTAAVLAADMLRFSVDVLVSLVARLSAPSIPATRESEAERDVTALHKRAERLQRLGFLYDEGLYVSRLPPPGTEVTPATLKEVSMFVNVLHLMSVPVDEFETLTHRINREWEAPRTKALVTRICRALAMRAEAVQTQMNVVENVFPEESDETRRGLLNAVLKSELEMIALLEENICGQR